MASDDKSTPRARRVLVDAKLYREYMEKARAYDELMAQQRIKAEEEARWLEQNRPYRRDGSLRGGF